MYSTRKRLYNATKKLDKMANSGLTIGEATAQLAFNKKIGWSTAQDLDRVANDHGFSACRTILTDSLVKALRRVTR